jgi:hypothetical protein
VRWGRILKELINPDLFDDEAVDVPSTDTGPDALSISSERIAERFGRPEMVDTGTATALAFSSMDEPCDELVLLMAAPSEFCAPVTWIFSSMVRWLGAAARAASRDG